MVARARKTPDIESRLISFNDAASYLQLNPTTLRQRKAGTEELTHVRLGRRVFLIRSEVLALVDRKIAEAQAENRRLQALLRVR